MKRLTLLAVLLCAVFAAGSALAATPTPPIKLAYIEGLSHSQIAERLSIPLGTVKSRMRLAYQKVRVALEDIR